MIMKNITIILISTVLLSSCTTDVSYQTDVLINHPAANIAPNAIETGVGYGPYSNIYTIPGAVVGYQVAQSMDRLNGYYYRYYNNSFYDADGYYNIGYNNAYYYGY